MTITTSNAPYAAMALARQPIVDSRLAVMGYELLYRKSANSLSADIFDEVSATSQVMSTALFGIGLGNLVGAHQAFIKLPRAYLLEPAGIPFDKDNVVIEVLADAQYDPMLLAALRRWSAAGYRIALSGFVFESKLVPFVQLAEFIKLDMRLLGQEGLHQQVEALRGFEVKIIAEKVETWDEYQFCRVLGLSLFQGYFFEKPEVLSTKSSKVNHTTLLQLMASLMQSDNLSIDDLERIVSQDAMLVHKLLRYLNSPVTGLVATIDSVRLAIMLIGADRLKAISNMLLMSEMVGDRPVLLEQTMVRAKHMELFAQRCGYGNEDKYFLAGMLSMIDACLGVPLEEILQELPLPSEFITAIVTRSGRVGSALEHIESYATQGHGGDAQEAEILSETYIEAVQWADQVVACF